MSVVIKQCSCIHESQDKLHGNKMRVHNTLEKTNKGKAKCTVCDSIKKI